MWQEDLTAHVGRALQRPVVLASTPAHTGGDWATALLSPPEPADAQDRVRQVPGVCAAQWHHHRLVLTLTPAARGQVVTDILQGQAPRHRQDPAPRELLDGPPPARRATGTGADLYPVRLAHARTAMLLRQGRSHQVLPAGEYRHALARLWQDLAPARVDAAAVRPLLLALSASHLATTRARHQHRHAPVIANLRRISSAFTHWFTTTRYTPRGSLPAPDDPIMDTYRLHLALAAATGLRLRAGLTHLGLSAPENL